MVKTASEECRVEETAQRTSAGIAEEETMPRDGM
jgi:hypothetical protein